MVEVRLTEESDGTYLTNWLNDPEISAYFPTYDLREVEDTVRIWVGFHKMQGGLTAVEDGEPCGMAVLNLQAFSKYKHQALISIIVAPAYRNRGIGTKLLSDLEKLAKEKHHLEFLHLEVYSTNPAFRLYERQGYIEFGRHEKFIKDPERGYIGKICMQKEL